MRESGCGWFRSSGRPSNEILTPQGTLFALAQASFLLAEPLFPEYPRRRAESLELLQCVPDGRHESLFERGDEDALGDPVGGIGGRFAIRDGLKLLHDGPGFEEKLADPLEEEDGAVGGFCHRLAWASNISGSLIALGIIGYICDIPLSQPSATEAS